MKEPYSAECICRVLRYGGARGSKKPIFVLRIIIILREGNIILILKYYFFIRAVMVQGLTLPTFTSMIMGSIPGLVKEIF